MLAFKNKIGGRGWLQVTVTFKPHPPHPALVHGASSLRGCYGGGGDLIEQTFIERLLMPGNALGTGNNKPSTTTALSKLALSEGRTHSDYSKMVIINKCYRSLKHWRPVLAKEAPPKHP